MVKHKYFKKNKEKNIINPKCKLYFGLNSLLIAILIGIVIYYSRPPGTGIFTCVTPIFKERESIAKTLMKISVIPFVVIIINYAFRRNKTNMCMFSKNFYTYVSSSLCSVVTINVMVIIWTLLACEIGSGKK
jgi:uncharacterized membrane protein